MIPKEQARKAQLRITYVLILTVLIFFALPFFIVRGWYNGGGFYGILVGIGMVYALLVSLNGRRRFRTIARWAFIPLILVLLSVAVFAGEGAICIIVIGGMLSVLIFFGAILGWAIADKIWARYTMSLLLLGTILLGATTVPRYNKGVLVQDSVTVNAPAERAWEVLSHRVIFGKSSDFFFRNGVSYPYAMELQQSATAPALVVLYNNGEIAAPVSRLEPGRSFTFHFDDTVATMREKDLYNGTNTMHIRNHFVVDSGQFLLQPLGPTQCRIVTSSRFRHRFEPEFYTNAWVTYFLHGIHRHVLATLQEAAEAPRS